MGWTMTTYEQTDEGMVVTEHYKPHVTEGKHGTHVIPFTSKYGEGFDVTVYDNTEDGIDEDTVRKIAEHASESTIWWSDDRLCNWMFDFKVRGHWCEGLFHNNGLPDEVESIWKHLHVNVYE